jgi:deoxyribodipyrimidine photolyase-related protein
MARKYLRSIDKTIPRVDPHNFNKAVFILHDQLNLDAWPDDIRDDGSIIILMESRGKGEEIPHHKVKAAYILSCMRHFALECHQKGLNVFYHSTDGHFDDGLKELFGEFEGELIYMQPSEWDTRERLGGLDHDSVRIRQIENTFSLSDPKEWVDKIEPGYRMEYFYRNMRRQTGYLMDGDKPEGGEWNYDKENRETIPKGLEIPEIPRFDPDEVTKEVMQMVEEYFPNHFGVMKDFGYAVTRKQALELLDDFIEHRLDEFGPYEDALKTGNHTLFHSQLSLYMNNGLLHPKEVCDRAVEAYEAGNARLNSVEGFIRQIIGWREFIKIYYEAMMPEVRDANHFGFTEALPEMYWTGETEMKCMEQSLKPVIDEAYSHHIQRLMILSNFSNLTETDPHELNKWFWFAYADAYEWVELPNVLGMSTSTR